MASQFDSEFAAGSAADYVAIFGEPIVYEPRGGQPRTIQAVVDRSGLKNDLGVANVLTMALAIEALDDPKDGIPWSTVDTGGDHVVLPVWPGARPTRLPLAKRVADPVGGLCKVSVGKS